MRAMWADTLLAAERAHVLSLMVWAVASILTGTALLAWLRRGGRSSPLLDHFAIQTAAWGAVNVVLALVAFRGLALRDLAAATQLDRFLWLNIGLDVGYILVGVTLALLGWRLGRRLGLVGAGLGVIIQGSALVVLDVLLVVQLTR